MTRTFRRPLHLRASALALVACGRSAYDRAPRERARRVTATRAFRRNTGDDHRHNMSTSGKDIRGFFGKKPDARCVRISFFCRQNLSHNLLSLTPLRPASRFYYSIHAEEEAEPPKSEAEAEEKKESPEKESKLKLKKAPKAEDDAPAQPPDKRKIEDERRRSREEIAGEVAEVAKTDSARRGWQQRRQRQRRNPWKSRPRRRSPRRRQRR